MKQTFENIDISNIKTLENVIFLLKKAQTNINYWENKYKNTHELQVDELIHSQYIEKEIVFLKSQKQLWVSMYNELKHLYN